MKEKEEAKRIIDWIIIILKYTPIYSIYAALRNFDEAAGGLIYNPESLKHLDKANIYINKVKENYAANINEDSIN